MLRVYDLLADYSGSAVFVCVWVCVGAHVFGLLMLRVYDLLQKSTCSEQILLSEHHLICYLGQLLLHINQLILRNTHEKLFVKT